MNIQSITALSEIQSHLQAIGEDTTIYQEINFDSRTDALDFIDFHIIDRIEGLQQTGKPDEKLNTLKQCAKNLKFDLEKIDINLFVQLREEIRIGMYTPSSFKEMVRGYLGNYFADINQPDKVGYDNLDVFINGLLSDHAAPETIIERQPEMVFYQKTPARIVFEMMNLAELSEDDVFFDLGSGLGQVTILVNLLSGVKTIGIEYEPAYCKYAKACASQLNLSNIEFINTEAQKGDYRDGTVFFMYTPFEGNMLQDMLNILQQVAQTKPIRIFTYGPCSAQVAGQSWLRCVNGNAEDIYKLYEFRSDQHS